MRLALRLFVGVLLGSGQLLIAESAGANDMAEMQKKMNAEVMEQPFLAEQPEKVEAYIKEAMQKNLKPAEYKGKHWRAGYTCRDLLRWSWQEYRDCRYYHRYYGYYYPYR